MKHWDECTPVQQIERWENVLRVLNALTPHQRKQHWDMSAWGTKTDCGTVACAAGHCGLDTWFRRRGFSMQIKRASDGCFDASITSPIAFFGEKGCDDIFYRARHRPVSTVIREVRTHIRQLKS